jgi:NodT family efflux transporter outer membrane factor (OMF) lipoprotein
MTVLAARGRRSVSWVLLSGCAVIFTACATPSDQTLSVPTEIERLAGTQSFAAQQMEWPSDRWWQEFGDAQLNTLIEEGLAGAIDMRVAEARFARANALVAGARSRLFPTIDGSAAIGSTRQSYNYLIPEQAVPRGWNEYGEAALSLSWDLDFWGRNRAALAAARSEAEAANAEAAAARLVVSAGIAAAYADFESLHAERDASENAVEVRQRTLQLMKGRKSEGLENDAAVGRAEAALAAALGERASIDEAIVLTRNRIAALLGAGPDRGLTIQRPTVTAQREFGLPANVPAELIGRRPDIIAARQRVEASSSRIEVARAAFYPNVNLAALVGVQALGLGDVFKSGSQFGAAGPAITLPIFNAGRLEAQERAAQSEYEMAVASYDGTLVQALREVADAAASERALSERLAHAVEAERAASSAWSVANNRYRGGLATYLDVLAAEDTLISARRTAAVLKARAFALKVALIRSLGGGFHAKAQPTPNPHA